MRPQKVLIVEDKFMQYSVLKRFLNGIEVTERNQYQFEVLPYTLDVPTAKVHITWFDPDIILIDLNLNAPEDGWQLIEYLNDNGFDIPYMILSDAKMPSVMHLVRKHRVLSYQTKRDTTEVEGKTDKDQLLANIYLRLEDRNIIGGGGFRIKNKDIGVEEVVPFGNGIVITKLTNRSDCILYYFDRNDKVQIYAIRSPLTAFYRKLPKELYIKTHQSYIVNLDRIIRIRWGKCELQGNKEAKISRANLPKLKAAFRKRLV